MVWPIMWIFALTGMIAYDSCFTLEDHLQLPKIISLSAVIYMALAYLTCVATFLNHIVHRRKLPRILSVLRNIDKILFLISGINIYKRERSYLIKNLVALCIVLVILEVGFCWEGSAQSYISVLYIVFENSPLIINSLVLFQFKIWVRKIYERLHTLNFIIKRHIKRDTNMYKKMFTSCKIVN